MSVSGVYQYVSTPNAPKGIAIASGTVLTKSSVQRLFSMKPSSGGSSAGPPTSLNLDGASFEDDGAVEEFASEVGKSLTLAEVAFRGSVGFNPRLFIPSLQENVSLQKLDLSHCGIDADMMVEIAANVVPWSRTVIDWNFADNEQIGDRGAVAFMQALAQSMSSTQRISVRNCAIQNSMGTILVTCTQLPSLVQFDASLNAEIGSESCAKALSDLDDLLARNGKMLLRQATHISLSTQATIPQPVASVAAASVPTVPPSTDFKQEEKKPPADKHHQHVQARAMERKGSFKSSPASVIQRGPVSTTAPISAAQSSPAHPEDASLNVTSPPPVRQPSGEARRATTPSAPRSGSQQRAGSSSRRAGESPSRPRPHAVNSPSRARILDVQDGADEWKRIKDQYNQFIHMPGSKPKPIVLSEPKFVLGKRMDKIKERPSSAFLASPGTTRERQPTPAERRKLAPWADPNNKEKVYVGAEEVVLINNGKDKLRIVNGGDVTFIENDPRDVGYIARKIQQKEMLVRTTGAFASNTTRDMRWGTDSSTELVRQAQAPGPGAYTVESDLERNIRKWQQQRQDTSTGKKRFGATGSVRHVFDPAVTDAPGPGAYEIP